MDDIDPSLKSKKHNWWSLKPRTPGPQLPSLEPKDSAYEHTLDTKYDEEAGQGKGEAEPEAEGDTNEAESDHASPYNQADETADLNFREPLDIPEYKDITGQDALKLADNRPELNSRSFNIFLSTIFRGRALPVQPLLASSLWCVAAVAISYASRTWPGPHKDDTCRQWCTPFAVDSDTLSYVGFALFLLTSFRVSEAYGRYMEAARVWTTITGTISSFAKYVMQAFPPGMIHHGDRQRMLSFLVAFPVALKRDLRGEKDLSELKSILGQKDLAALQHSDSMPSYCLAVLSGYLLKAKDKESEFPQAFIIHLIGWVADLAGSADVCTQIKTMPAPYSYVTHLNTFLGLWLFFLPFAVVEFMGWLTIPLVIFVSYGILGVVSNASELEDPFGSDFNDLPLGRMSLKIQKDVEDIYKSQLQGSATFFSQLDPKDEMWKSGEFWLNTSEESKKTK